MVTSAKLYSQQANTVLSARSRSEKCDASLLAVFNYRGERMSSDKTTAPIPWMLKITKRYDEKSGISPDYEVLDSSGHVIFTDNAECFGPSEDDAQLIVRAVNCHDELINVAQLFVDHLSVTSNGGYRNTRESIEKLIAIAKGGA